MSAKPTPGPWKWWTSNSFLRLTGRDGQDGGVLHASVSSSGCATVTVREGDRALIKASPDLLEALTLITQLEKTILDEWDAVERVIPEILKIARAAIDKATGENDER